MKKIFRYYIILLVMAILGSSCNEWLDVKPEAQVESKDLFTHEKGYQDALIGCYIELASSALYGQNMSMTYVEYLAQHWDFSVRTNHPDETAIKNFEYTTEVNEDYIESIYAQYYKVVVHANNLLENIRKNGSAIQSEKLCNMIEGEALAIRAFCHTDVLRLFGQLPQNATVKVQLPYAKEVTTEMIPYYSYEKFVELILKDIEDAQVLLQKSDPVMDYTFDELDNFTDNEKYEVELENDFMGYRRFRFNYWAMEALKARLYLYTGAKENARIAANNVINAKTSQGDAILELAGSNDFADEAFTCPSECLLAISNSDIEKAVNALFFTENESMFLTDKHYKELFETTILGTNNRANNTIWKESKYTDGMVWAFQKYKQPKESLAFSTKAQMVPLLRLSEMYLIAMEGASTLAEANALYKTYMEARDIDIEQNLTQSELNKEIINEYRREFFGEGQMFFVYKRLGYNRIPWKTDREVVEQDYIVPLPATELGSN